MMATDSGAKLDKNENGEKKRKRIARACFMCQQKKIRCDGQTPACRNCTMHKTDCVYKQTQKRRAARKGASYIEALEARLGKMESLIKGSEAHREVEGEGGERPARQESCEPSITIELATATGTLSAVETIRTPQSDYDVSMLNLVVAECGSPRLSPGSEMSTRCLTMEDHGQGRYEQSNSPEQTGEDVPSLINSRGLSSSTTSPQNPCIGSLGGFSMFSPENIQWVTEKTGNTSFKDSIYAASQDETRLNYWRSDSFSGIFTRPIFKELPPKHETVALVDRFFKNFNSVCPLFNQPIVMELLDRQYSPNPYDGAGWWASLNIIIAISISLQSHESTPPVATYDKYESAWDYLQNGLAVFTELSFRCTDLFAVQALLGMSLFLQGTSDARPTASLIGSAVRLCHTLGLHKKPGGNMSPADIEQRKRIFWMAYRLDKDLCVRTGIPILQDDDDMDVDLPDEHPEDGLGILTLDNGEGHIPIFRLMAQFSMIEGKVHRELYSTKAAAKTWEEVLDRVSELDSELEDWKEAIPIQCQPEYEVKMSNSPLSLHLIQMHFAYYNCLRTIHKASVIGNPMSRSDKTSWQKTDVAALNSRLQSSVAMCLSAARASVRLVRSLPLQDLGFVWRVLYFPVSSLLTLFANIIQAPTDSRARSDLRLMKAFVEFLAKLQHEESGEIRRVFKVCSEFERIARDVIAKAREVPSTTATNKSSNHNQSPHEALLDGRNKQQPAAMLTPKSAVASSSLSHLSAGMIQSSSSSTLDLDAGLSQFSQYFPDMMGRTLNPYPEAQPMFPPGLMLPWNMNNFENSSLLPNTFSNGSYDFDPNV